MTCNFIPLYSMSTHFVSFHACSHVILSFVDSFIFLFLGSFSQSINQSINHSFVRLFEGALIRSSHFFRALFFPHFTGISQLLPQPQSSSVFWISQTFLEIDTNRYKQSKIMEVVFFGKNYPNSIGLVIAVSPSPGSAPGTGVTLRSAKTKDIPMEIVKAVGLLR